MPHFFVVEFLFATITMLCGLAGGWYVRGLFLRRSSAVSPSPNPASADLKKSREVLVSLQETAESMAVDVGRHNTRVQEINAELTSLDAQRPKDVLSAVSKVLEANKRMHERLLLAEEKLHEQALQIESHVAEARTDALTGAANRRAFDDELQRCLAEFELRGRAFSLMMVDIDHFKKFNDTHGHQAGDHVLKGVARAIKLHVSKLEIVARYGGEEFAVIFPDSNLAAARPMAERARAAIAAASMEFHGQRLTVTASAGIAEIQPGEDSVSIIKRADAALYDAKKGGRDRAHWHDGVETHLLLAPAPKSPTIPEPIAPVVETPPAEKVAGERPFAELLRDTLTGLPTGMAFEEDVRRRIAERKRGGPPVTAIFARIDNFAELSSRFGAGTDDTVLRAVTQFLRAAMREMDHVARYDQDLFALLLPSTTLSDATLVAERLRRAIARCRLPIGTEQYVQFTVSLGLAEAGRSDSPERLIELVTDAMRASVAAGGNQSHVYTGREFAPVAAEPVSAM